MIGERIYSFFWQKKILWLLLFINLGGTLYGYIWYGEQLKQTPVYLWPWVADSPTASLFFTIVLILFIRRKQGRLIEAFAAVTLFKYGIWATVMNIWSGYAGGLLVWEHYLLIFSHLGMAIQAVLYSPHFTFRFHHLLIVAIWTISNDIMDYTIGIFPWLNYRLHPYLNDIYLFTLSLSLLSITLFYLVVVRRQNKRQEL